MKLKMQSKTKKYSLIGGSLAILTLVILIPLMIKAFKIGYEPNNLYNYTYTPQIKYKVEVVNDELYQAEDLEENQYYLLKFIDKILPTFSFELKGSNIAEITGEYQIIAQIRGFIMKEQKKEIIWQKEVVLVPKVNIQLESDQLKKEHTIVIDLDDYKEFAERIFTEANVRMDSEVCFKMEGQLKINKQEQLIEVPIDTSMIIPLGQNYFTVMREGEKAITENLIDNSRQSPLQIKYIIGSEAIICILGGVGLISVVRAENLTQEELKEKKIKKIFRLYGSRLIGVDHLENCDTSLVYQLKCFHDLIKLAEELEQPIFYLTEEATERDYFYVFDKERLYFYHLT